MADSRVVSRYVKSLLELSVERGALEAVHKDMLLFGKVCKENRQFSLMLKSPIIRHEKKKDILQKLLTGKMHPLMLAIVDIVTRKNREPLLEAIAAEFHNAYNEHKGIGKASVITTLPMDKELRAEIEAVVIKLSNKKQVEIEEMVDPGMIGGFVLNVGDRQIDASLRTKLKNLQLTFTQSTSQTES